MQNPGEARNGVCLVVQNDPFLENVLDVFPSGIDAKTDKLALLVEVTCTCQVIITAEMNTVFAEAKRDEFCHSYLFFCTSSPNITSLSALHMKWLWLRMKKSKSKWNNVKEGLKTGRAMKLNTSAHCLLFETKLKRRMDTAAGGNGIESSKSLQGLKRVLKWCWHKCKIFDLIKNGIEIHSDLVFSVVFNWLSTFEVEYFVTTGYNSCCKNEEQVRFFSINQCVRPSFNVMSNVRYASHCCSRQQKTFFFERFDFEEQSRILVSAGLRELIAADLKSEEKI